MPLLSSPPSVLAGALPEGWRLGHTQLQLGDVRIGEVDADRVEWILNDIDGWWDTPDVNGAEVDQPTNHGAWVGPAYMTPRLITLRVTISAPDEARRDAALARLSAAAPFAPTSRLLVEGSLPQPTWAMVRQSGRILVEKTNPRSAFVQLGLLAPDPRRYGLYPASGSVGISVGAGPGITPPIELPIELGTAPGAGRIVLDNIGNLPGPWTAIITGPVTNPRIINETTGEILELALTLPAGQYLRLDAGNGTVRDQANGDRTGFISYGTDWWLLAEGENYIRFAGTTTGQPLLSMTAYPAWK